MAPHSGGFQNVCGTRTYYLVQTRPGPVKTSQLGDPVRYLPTPTAPPPYAQGEYYDMNEVQAAELPPGGESPGPSTPLSLPLPGAPGAA